MLQRPTTPGRRNPIVASLAIGCAAVFVLAIVAGGVAAWLAVQAARTAFDRSERAVAVARTAIATAGRAASDARSSSGAGARDDAAPGSAHEPAGGIALLKAFVTAGDSGTRTVPRTVLETALPRTIGALRRSHRESSRTSVAGITGTSASATYGVPGAGTIDIAVTDAGNMTGLTTFMTMAMSAVTSDDANGYERTRELGGVRVHERWVAAGKHVQLLGLIRDRFVVSITSDGLAMPSAERAFTSVDVAKLASVEASKAAPQ